MKTYTKESFIEALIEIRDNGSVPTGRKNNDGGVGNTLEDLLMLPTASSAGDGFALCAKN